MLLRAMNAAASCSTHSPVCNVHTGEWHNPTLTCRCSRPVLAGEAGLSGSSTGPMPQAMGGLTGGDLGGTGGAASLRVALSTWHGRRQHVRQESHSTRKSVHHHSEEQA